MEKRYGSPNIHTTVIKEPSKRQSREFPGVSVTRTLSFHC